VDSAVLGEVRSERKPLPTKSALERSLAGMISRVNPEVVVVLETLSTLRALVLLRVNIRVLAEAALRRETPVTYTA